MPHLKKLFRFLDEIISVTPMFPLLFLNRIAVFSSTPSQSTNKAGLNISVVVSCFGNSFFNP